MSWWDVDSIATHFLWNMGSRPNSICPLKPTVVESCLSAISKYLSGKNSIVLTLSVSDDKILLNKSWTRLRKEIVRGNVWPEPYINALIDIPYHMSSLSLLYFINIFSKVGLHLQYARYAVMNLVTHIFIPHFTGFSGIYTGIGYLPLNIIAFYQRLHKLTFCTLSVVLWQNICHM